MFRKTQVLGMGCFLFATSTLNAGFYAGASIGSDTVDFKKVSHVTQQNPGFPVGFDVYDKSHLSATGVFGSLFAGFGGVFYKAFYLAGELNGNFSSTEAKNFNYDLIHSNFVNGVLKIRNTVGLSVLPGFQFTPNTLFYGRLGWANSQIQQTTEDTTLVNFNIRRSGFRYGLGISQAITDRVALRMDYSRTSYSTIKTGIFDPAGNVTKFTRLIPNQQLIEFGVVFNFDQVQPTK